MVLFSSDHKNDTKYLHINTKLRPYLKGQQEDSNNFLINMPCPIKNIISLRIIQAQIPDVSNIIKIFQPHNTFEIVTGIGQLLVTVPPGSYPNLIFISPSPFNIIRFADGDTPPNSIITAVQSAINYARANAIADGTITAAFPEVEFIYISILKKYAFQTKDQYTLVADEQIKNNEPIAFEINFDTEQNEYIHKTLGWRLGFKKSIYSDNPNYIKDITFGITNCKSRCIKTLITNGVCDSLISSNIDGITEYISNINNNLTAIPVTFETAGQFYIANISVNISGNTSFYLLSIDDFNSSHNDIIEGALPSNNTLPPNIITKITTNTASNNDTILNLGLQPLTLFRTYKNPTTLSKLRIKLYDENLDLADINDNDWSLIIELNIKE